MRSEAWENRVHIEGRVFNHSLQKRVTGEQSKNPGTEYIGGTLTVATDEEGYNLVPVRFTYVTAVYSKSGKPNETFSVLEQIINDGITMEKNGKEDAPQVRIDGDIEVNDFMGRNNEMVEAKGVRGSFAHFANGQYHLNEDENKRNTFRADMLIAGIIDQEPENADPYLQIRGYVFNFRNDLIPVTFSVHNKGGMDYFTKCDISNENPLFTKVWGNIISTTQKIETEVESAFGAPQVDVTTRTLRAWEIEGCAVEPYEWDDDSTMTIAEFKELLDRREETKAEAKKRAEEYQASKSGQSGFPTAGSNVKSDNVASVPGGFKF